MVATAMISHLLQILKEMGRRLRNLVRLVSRFVQAAQLDVFDSCWNLSSEARDYLGVYAETLPPAGIQHGIRRFWSTLRGRTRSELSDPWIRLSSSSIAIFVSTNNQRAALTPLIKRLPSATTTVLSSEEIPKGLVSLLSLAFLPLLLVHYIRASGYRRRAMNHFFDSYWSSYGLYVYFRLILATGPSAVIMSNDHSLYNRALLKGANAEGIATFYVQHASVTSKFPALDFTYALLDGRDALEKYDAIGPSDCKAFLIGIMKLDDYITNAAEPRSPVNRIGICFNAGDPADRIEHLCESLTASGQSARFILRPHPSDRRYERWHRLADRFGAQASDSRAELSLDFLRDKVDAVLAGESNILLEAALLNVYPLYYDYALEQRDHYGFLQHGLVTQRLEEPNEATDALQMLSRAIHWPRSRTARYCATIGTEYEGRSTDLALELIDCLLSARDVPQNRWRRVLDTVHLEAYTLR